MEFWTVLFITVLSGNLEGAKIALPYPSMAECEKSTVVISTTLSYDHSMVCVPTDYPSGSISPKHRDEGN